MICSNLGPTPAKTQARSNVLAFPRPPDGPISEAHIRWWVAQPEAAAADGIEPWKIEAFAYRIRILDEIAARDAIDPEPLLPLPSDDEIEAALRKDGRPKALQFLEGLGPKPWKRTPAGDVTQRDDSSDGPEVVPFTAKPKKAKAKPERSPRDLPPWLQGCEKDGRDQIIPNLANLMIALRGDPDLANTLVH